MTSLPTSAILSLLIAITFPAFRPGTSTAQEVRLQPLFSITGADMLRKLNLPSDVFIDEKHHEIYVVDAGNQRVVIFDMDGFYRHQFAVPGGSGNLNSLVVNDRGEILMVLDGRIAVCDFRGSLLEYIEFHGFPGAEEVSATRLKIDKDDNYYVLYARKQQVLAFDSDWNFRFAIGKESFPTIVKRMTHGKEQEESMVKSLSIGDICVDNEGMIYLVDPMASYVFIFDNEGEYVRSIGEPGGTFKTLSLPSGVAVDSQGTVLVVDATGHALLGYHKEGKLLFALGGLGKAQGWFYFPKYVSTDTDGRIYVVEPFLSRIQVLRAYPKTAG